MAKITLENLCAILGADFAEKKINEAIRIMAVAPSLNLRQYGLLKKVCKEAIKIADEMGVPMSCLTYVGCTSSAYELKGFLKYYNGIEKMIDGKKVIVGAWNAEKAKAIVEFAKYFGAHFGYAHPSDRVYHAAYRIYNTVTTDFELFKSAVDALPLTAYNAKDKSIKVEHITMMVSEAIAELTPTVASEVVTVAAS